MKKTLVSAVTMAVVALIAIFAFGSPASATGGCIAQRGSTISIIGCSVPNEVQAYTQSSAGCATGHFEVWNYNKASELKNSTQQRWCPSDTFGYYFPWNTNKVCAEFWYLSGGTWKRWGTIPCTFLG